MKKVFHEKTKSVSFWLPYIIGLVGILLRLKEYLNNKSIWYDEATLVLNIINHSFLQLVHPLDNQQYAPLGFLWIEKLFVFMVNTSEYALRLPPLLVSLAAIVLFFPFAKQFVPKRLALISFFVFCMLDRVTDYADEVKQYSFEIFATMIIYLVTVRFIKKPTIQTACILGFTGAILMWFSFPVVFILTACSIVLLFQSLRAKNQVKLILTSGISVLWAASFIGLYFVSIRSGIKDESLIRFWMPYFARLPIGSTPPFWNGRILLSTFENPFSVAFPLVTIVSLIFGVWSLYKQNKVFAGILVLPILVTFIASGFEKYPFAGRFLLFYVPVFIIIFVSGVEAIIIIIFLKFKLRYASIVTCCIILISFYQPLFNSAYYLVHYNSSREEIRPVIDYYQNHRQKQDLLYVYYGAIPAFQYYRLRYGIQRATYVLGKQARNSPGEYLTELNRLKSHSRVWVLFSHVVSQSVGNESNFFLSYLNRIGVMQDHYVNDGAGIFLYDLHK